MSSPTTLPTFGPTSNSTNEEAVFTGLNEGVLWSGVGAAGLGFIWYIYCKIKGCIDRREERALELWLQRRHAPPSTTSVKEKEKDKNSGCCGKRG